MKKLSDKPPYRKWVGVLLGYLIPGLAHFLTGERAAGIRWLLLLSTMGVACIVFAAVPGTASYCLAVLVMLVGFILGFVVLKQSYRAVRRIGFLGWILVLFISFAGSSIFRIAVTQFVQCYKIPTGAMQPTVMGKNKVDPLGCGNQKTGFLEKCWYGRNSLEVRAKENGVFKGPYPNPSKKPIYSTYMIGRERYLIPAHSEPLIEPGSVAKKGDLLWKGLGVAGDYLFVEKISYMFREPRRGEIVVFKTDGIEALQEGSMYIKRLVGLPGETISIKPPFFYVNGKKIVEPEILRVISGKQDGYSGYMLASPPGVGSILSKESDEVTLGEDEYFVVGDNSGNSYDSRYWGPVPRKNIIGKVTRVYWPFSRINALDGKQ